MKSGKNSKKVLTTLAMGFFAMIGTYNAVVINSDSIIDGTQVQFAKRIDELYGVVVSKREVAASLNWQKVSVKQAAVYRQFKNELASAQVSQASGDQADASQVVSEAAVQDSLNLNLTQVMNPKKWQQGLKEDQFSGSLNTNNGVIESLSVSLPGGEGVSVSFSEMTGNVFEYDLGGELYSGMMYQESQNSYVITLTNGPLEGTRLTFTGEASVEQIQQNEEAQRMLAENSESEAGQQIPQEQQAPEANNSDGEVAMMGAQEQELSYDQQLQQQDILAQEQGVQMQDGSDTQGLIPQDQQT
jgi:hypothetical protein